MATFPLSFTIQSDSVNHGATESSKLILSAHCVHGIRVARSLEKTDMERKHAHVKFKNYAAKDSFSHRNFKVVATSRISVFQNKERSAAYRFRTEIGGQVKVLVRKKNLKYSVHVEVTSLELNNGEDNKLVMSWGIFRSDSSQFMPLDFRSSTPDARSRTVETPFAQESIGKFTVELDFEVSLTPFYLSFQIKFPLDGDSKSPYLKSHRKTNFCLPVGLGSGYPAPLGLSFLADGSMNFALYARSGKGVVLCLYDDPKAEKPTLEIDLDPYVNRTGDIWHASMDRVLPFVSYGYRCKRGIHGEGNKFSTQHVLLDPYAKIIGNAHFGKLIKEPPFDWGRDVRPCVPMEKLVVYRINVARFTEHKSSGLPNEIAGTFSGITEKLHHFKDLGVNAILLEPIFTSDEKEGPYFPCHFFSPMNFYGPSGDSIATINSMKEMVKILHANGIEVLVEAVFTHTADSCALREIDKSSYYHVSGDENLEKTRNYLNCNYPIVQQMILDSLRYWVMEFHVDGFSFINATVLLKGFHGEFISRPPLVEAIAFDPLLSKTKIIADSWDPYDMASKEITFPHWKRWAEINTRFCDDVRNFLRGEGLLSDLATRLCGSGDIFLNGRGPSFSFNFIARNFGLPLVDLVSFSSDDLSSHLSWNCGEEGPTKNTAVLERRLKHVRNFLFILFISLGVPVLNMGDECGQSSGGSPAYDDRKPFDWNALRTGFGIQTLQFISFLSSLRMRRSDLLQRRRFLKEENIEWRGRDQSLPNWEDPTSRFLGMTLKVDEDSSDSRDSDIGDLFVAFNRADHSEIVILPRPPPKMEWLRLVDTALPFPGFFSKDGEHVLEQMTELLTYEMQARSCVLFEARSLND
ncbi:isoamylase [Sarracenia purpurea var. burkii]